MGVQVLGIVVYWVYIGIPLRKVPNKPPKQHVQPASGGRKIFISSFPRFSELSCSFFFFLGGGRVRVQISGAQAETNLSRSRLGMRVPNPRTHWV